VVLDVTGITVGAVSALSTVERVAVQVRANGGATGATAHHGLTVGTGSRKLWVAPGQTVVLDTDAKTAYVLSGATVVKDVTAWVDAVETFDDGEEVDAEDWLAIRPGSGLLYTNRTGGANRHAVAVAFESGWIW
jgi:hypothetical protein